MNKNTEPAFPQNQLSHGVGLTKREYFAAMALQGWLANKYSANHDQKETGPKAALVAIRAADSLIIELSKDET
jgi:hypothetical protein